jgi:hypothetical protein
VSGEQATRGICIEQGARSGERKTELLVSPPPCLAFRSWPRVAAGRDGLLRGVYAPFFYIRPGVDAGYLDAADQLAE